MASGDDRSFNFKCFNFCFKPKKKPRRNLFPPLTEEELVEPVSPVDEYVHGGSVFPTIATQQQPEGDAPGSSSVENEGEITIEQNPQGSGDDITPLWLQPERHASASNLGIIPGGPKKPQVLAPDVQNALEQYEKLALQQSLERENQQRIERENQEKLERENQEKLDKENQEKLDKENQEKLDKENQDSSSNPKLSESEAPLGRACSRCAAVDKPRLNSWSDLCEHFFCDDCMADYLGVMVENRAWKVNCPAEGCTEMKTAEVCRRYLPEEVGDRWVESIPEEARNA